MKELTPKRKKMNPKESNNSRLARKPLVAKYFRQGIAVRRIAELVARDFGRTSPFNLCTIQKDINQLRQEWRDEQKIDMDMAIREKIDQHQYAIEQLWEQWEKSKTDFKVKDTKSRFELQQPPVNIGPDEDPVEADLRRLEAALAPPVEILKGIERTVTKKVMVGDAKFIDSILRHQQEICKLLGYYPSEKMDITSGGQKLTFYNFLKKTNKVE